MMREPHLKYRELERSSSVFTFTCHHREDLFNLAIELFGLIAVNPVVYLKSKSQKAPNELVGSPGPSLWFTAYKVDN
jgi:hypothetical protein